MGIALILVEIDGFFSQRISPESCSLVWGVLPQLRDTLALSLRLLIDGDAGDHTSVLFDGTGEGISEHPRI